MKYRQQIIQLALPAMMENILQMLMGIVDNYLVAKISLVAVSGVSIANNIITIYQAIFIALGAAVSSLIAKSKGEENDNKQERFLSDALSITLILSLLLGLISWLGAGTLLRWLGTDQVVTQVGGSYLSIVGGLTISLGLLTIFGAMLRAEGNSKLPMYVSLLTNFINAVLAVFAIFIFRFGIVGVALATVVSRFIGVFILARRLPIKKMIKTLRFFVSRELLDIALPSAGERLMMRAGDVIIVVIIVHFGTKVVAGNAIGETLTQFNYMPGMAVATATIIMVAHQLGSQEKTSISIILRESYLLSSVSMFCIGGLVFLSGHFLSQLFTNDITALEASYVVLLYSLLGGPATAGTLVYTALWQGLGKAKFPFYATTFGMWLIRIVVGYLLGIVFQLGLTGVWLATVFDNIFRWTYLRITYKKMVAMQEGKD